MIGIADRTRALYAAIVAVLAVLIVVLLFANVLFEADLSMMIEVCFVAVALALLVAVALFLAEVTIAASMLRDRRRELLATHTAACASMKRIDLGRL
jgi:uncharacterized membrane protein YhaH (DUF805 family)